MLIQVITGVLGAVSNITAQALCPFHMSFSWKAPWSPVPHNYTSYCVSITEIPKNLAVYNKCGIHTTSLITEHQEDICGGKYSVTVLAVNQVGNGSEATIFFNGITKI